MGTACLDTGASITCTTSAFVERAGLELNTKVPPRERKTIVVPTGQRFYSLGTVDVPMMMQLLVNPDTPQCFTWERNFTLTGVHVFDLGPSSPRDVYVSWNDYSSGFGSQAQSPLGHLVHLVSTGARILKSPRPEGATVISDVVFERRPASAGGADRLLASLSPSLPSLRDRILERFPKKLREEKAVMVELVLAMFFDKGRERVFDPIKAEECTETIEFRFTGEPKEVSFQVQASRKVGLEVYDRELGRWVDAGFAEPVPYSTPAYGFALMVPKPGGKFRLAINPVGINSVTETIDPIGGYMPESMIHEVHSVGRYKYAVKLDLREAFVTMKLGPEAQRASTFTTPRGKYRWKHGYFGWHSFPAAFQKLIMEKVVLPMRSKFRGRAGAIAWIDDVVIGANDEDTLLAALTFAVDCLLSFGARLSLDKCEFFVQQFEWCGVEVDLEKNYWRVAQSRVQSLVDTPVPTDHTALKHVLGIIRYYFHGVTNHNAQRKRIALLASLDYDGVRLARHWTPLHTQAMRGAMQAIAEGKWQLVFDPNKDVYVSTDASGLHGFCVVATQYDDVTGEPLPIAFMSRGWRGKQTVWSAQTKECYAQLMAITDMMPKCFAYARVVLLCDNRNLAFDSPSADSRIERWKERVRSAGTVVRYWYPGLYNTISDYGSRTVHSDPDAILTDEEEEIAAAFAIIEASATATRRSARLAGLGTGAGAPVPAPTPATEISAAVSDAALPGLPALVPASDATVVVVPSVPTAPVSASSSSAPVAVAAGGAGASAVSAAPVADTAVAVASPWPRPSEDELGADVAASPAATSAVDISLPSNSSWIPGHQLLADVVVRILDAQAAAPLEEQRTWTGKHFKTIERDGRKMVFHGRRLLVPLGNVELKRLLMAHAHDERAHLPARDRVYQELAQRVYWVGMHADIEDYVRQCVRCQFVKTPHKPSTAGELSPSLPPYVNHTFYIDLKGPLPPGKQYILAVVEGVSRYTRLRVVDSTSVDAVWPVLQEVFYAAGTAPAVIRCDNGPPFNSDDFAAFCKEWNTRVVPGLPYRSEGQGFVESRFRPIASAIIATLGHRAPDNWPSLLGRIEYLLNITHCDPIHGSPYQILYGRPPRTHLSAHLDWSSPSFGADVLGVASATFDDYNEIVLCHHANMDALQSRALLDTSLAQSLRKHTLDAKAAPNDFAVGQWVIMYRTAPNKLLPFFTGPFKIVKMSRDRSAASLVHYLDAEEIIGPHHVSLLRHFDAARASSSEIAAFQLEEGQFLVDSVLQHRRLDDGSLDFLVKWVGSDVPTWEPGRNLSKVTVAKEYCEVHSLPPPGSWGPSKRKRKARVTGKS
jgi:hypothetical protein